MTSWPDDCTVRLIDMPVSVGGRISECPDGHIDIYINARHSEAGRRRDLEHELDHWRNDDLHNDLDIRAVESRHAKPLPPLIRAADLLSKSFPPGGEGGAGEAGDGRCRRPSPGPLPVPTARPGNGHVRAGSVSTFGLRNL